MNFKSMIINRLRNKSGVIISIAVLLAVMTVLSSVVFAANENNKNEANKKNVVSIYTNDKEVSFITDAKTISEALDDAQIKFNAEDEIITPSLDYAVSDGTSVVISKKIKKVQPLELTALDKQQIEKQEQERREAEERAKKEAAEKAAREKAEKAKKAAQSAVISSDKETITVNGKIYSVKKALKMRASAYSPQCDGGGRTATGKKPKYGYVAVDPKVIPLGTKLYIKTANGSWVYGYAVAEDTGGAIKGDRIDLFMNSKAEANRFGRRNVIVYVLG